MQYSWKILGHKKICEALESDMVHANIAHAYLFSGPEQIGKFSLATKFAMLLQCPNNCNKIGNHHMCPTCLQIEKGYHLDTIAVTDNMESIKIEEIREILIQLYLSTQSRYKILLIKNVERMTPEAVNALLKTLEEPPSNVAFLLTCSNIETIPATILSRVRLYKMKSFSDTQIRELVLKENPELPEPEKNTLIALSGGKPGKALKLLSDDNFFHSSKALYDKLFSFLQKKNISHRFQYVGQLVKDETSLKDFLDIFLAVLRYDLFQSIADSQAQEIILKKVALVKNFYSMEEMLKRNVNMRLSLENFMLTL